VPNLSGQEQEILSRVLGVIVVAVAVVDGALLGAWLWGRSRERKGAPPLFARTWSLLDVWAAGHIIIGAMLGLLIVIMVPVAAGMALLGVPADRIAGLIEAWMPRIAILSLIPQNVLLVGVPAACIALKYGQRLEDIGFTLRPDGRTLRLGFALGLLVMAVGFGMEWLVGQAARLALGPQSAQSLASFTDRIGNAEVIRQGMESPVWFVLLLLGGGILAPVGEEFFFRGFLYNAARRRFGFWPAVWISTLVFAMVHVGPLLILAIIPVGVLLAVAYERTGSLWVPIVMHVTNNSLALVLAYLFPQLV